ncbi:MAG: helix-turn-helix domain-containing protein [Prevotella sp.]|nr:helix-turn-helix domain-containing protein [Prevotella sp.]
MRRFISILFIWTVAIKAIGNPFMDHRFNITYLNMRNGLPGNNISDIHLDSYGFIWIATNGSGLLKYDGYNYYSPNTNKLGFTSRSNSCRNIAEDKFRRLWVAYEEGTDIVDLQTMHNWEPKGDPLIQKALSQQALTVYCDTKDCIWLVARTYIYYIQLGDNGEIKRVLPYRYSSDKFDITICDMEQNGTVWVTIEGGLYRLREKNGKIIRETISPAIQSIAQSDINDFVWKDTELWIATVNGLFCFDNINNLKRHYQKNDQAGIMHNTVTRLAIGPGNALIAGTLGGINIYNSTSDTFEQWSSKSKEMPLSSDFISCIKYMQGLLWIGTETGGIMKVAPRELLLTNYVHSDNPGSLSPNAVNAMYIEDNGTLWVGTVEGGLNRKESGSRQFTHFTKNNSSLPHNAVSTLSGDNRQQLWIGTWGGGICTINLEKHQQILPLSVSPEYVPLLVYIGALQYDEINDLMWIGSNNGLFYYDYHTGQIKEPFKECRTVTGCIGSIVDKEGWLWIGTLQGGIRVNLHSKSKDGNFDYEFMRYKLDQPASKIIEKMSCFCETKDGTLWIGSNEYGIYHRTLDKDGKPHYQNYNMQHGLANNGVKGIVEDKDGILWITTKNGLSQFKPQTGVFNNYSEDDGLPNSQFYWNSAISNRQGDIILGTTSGVCILHGINNNATYKGHLRFTHLNIDNRDITADGKYLKEDISLAKKLTLHESDKTLSFEFSALNYLNDQNGTYSYRLLGFEDEWIQLPTGQHSIRYTSLQSGNYTLEVKYASSLYAEEQIIQLQIKVIPYFWKTWWFISLFCLLLILSAIWLYRQRMKQMSEKIRRQEAEKAMVPVLKALNESKDPKQLQQRIESILHVQKQYEDSFNKSAEEDKANTEKENVPFMDRVIDILEKNYKNAEFGVPELCEAMHMSRPLLSKRLNEKAGLPTTQFIRNYRLNIAMQLLKESGGRNITEIAYSVGFNDPKYFTRCFTKLYGISPSAVK